jgi:hypothetical protein
LATEPVRYLTFAEAVTLHIILMRRLVKSPLEGLIALSSNRPWVALAMRPIWKVLISFAKLRRFASD